ncbi:aminoglycoside phosphotransferase family protein [Paenirhodobacter enshiensis]|uniref:aminoglycoside phosphotransferase family protein n=1 Tax=Paenirhodobacter enshiensis TaxID=1105367 RepID=UPI0035B0E413
MTLPEPARAFLAREGWQDALSRPLAGDASGRSYARLTLGEKIAVLMMSPSPDEVAHFENVGRWLLSNGFSAPRIMASDAPAGLMLIEDLGDDLIFDLVEADPAREAPLYGAITDALLALHRLAPPDFVAPLDATGLGDLTRLGQDWAPLLSRDAAAEVPDLVTALAARLDDLAPVLCLRDFHAQNMLWLPGRDGVARLGLLDFQDAVAAHPGYDLVSALQDVRRAVSPEVEAREIARYTAARGLDPDIFAADYALLGAQRALRIHAVFARLCLGAGKARYVDLMPRNWALLHRNLAHPTLAPLARAVGAAFAPPDAPLLERLKRECGSRPMR